MSVVVNDWTLLQFRLFKERLNTLEREVLSIQQQDPAGFERHPKVKLAKAVVDNVKEQRALAEWPETRQFLSARLMSLTEQDFESAIYDLLHLDLPVPYCEERHQFICKLLKIRLRKLKLLVA